MNPLPILRKMTEQDRIAELKKLSQALEKPASKAAKPRSPARSKPLKPVQ